MEEAEQGPGRVEADLASAAEAGDQAALHELVVRFVPALRAFVRGRVGPLMRARASESDVVQSTVREVLQHGRRFDHGGEEGFKQWLFTTAMRKILDKRKLHTAARRDVGRAVEGAEGAGLLAGAPALDASPSEAAVGAEQAERMARAFEQLSPDHREVVFLSRVVGLSRAEVAGELGRSEAAVRNLLHRALAEFARHLELDAERDGD